METVLDTQNTLTFFCLCVVINIVKFIEVLRYLIWFNFCWYYYYYCIQ